MGGEVARHARPSPTGQAMLKSWGFSQTLRNFEEFSQVSSEMISSYCGERVGKRTQQIPEDKASSGCLRTPLTSVAFSQGHLRAAGSHEGVSGLLMDALVLTWR